MMQVLNTEHSVLFKDNDYYHPIPQFYFITVNNLSTDDVKNVIRNAMNIKQVNDSLLAKKAEFNIVRIDEITHIGSHEMAY